MLAPLLLATPGAVARCHQQGLRHVVAWLPKDVVSAHSFSTQNDLARTSGPSRPLVQTSQRRHLSGASAQVENISNGPSIHQQIDMSNFKIKDTANNSNLHNNVIPKHTSPPPPPVATNVVRERRPNFIKDFEVPPDMSRLPPKFGDNQHIDIDAAMWEQLKSVVDTFHHKAPIRYAFAYGSGVFAQNGYDPKKKPMVDFIFAVSHPQHWHALNIQANPHHYSMLGKIGSKAVATMQESFGAGVYFNPFVEVNGMNVKYGVVSIDTLCNDLLNWDTLYLSGRLHKPVKILLDDPRTRLSNQVNLFNATRVALLSLPKQFTSEDLFTKIAGLSYLGDFRMSIGENPHKVQNIVRAQLSQFHRLYDPLLANLSNVTTLREGFLEQDDNPIVKSRTWHKLPPRLKQGALYRYHSEISKSGFEIVKEDGQELQSVATAPHLDKYLASTVQSIVQIPALTQSIKGIATAGVFKTSKYGLQKMGKWWARKQ
ncbi:Mitochondrial translocator assembly and maintenance protein 41 [Lunasporangiospora selenospora]|uniref:Phosphatidate cytidylyltransferase, mitochondrial n=1 Tax=Lunasporangiospora selenospora TaxID=979761 RepID=A0A9P6FZS7_9FUNG|nr:Mitochondrial translocator assembly and maintenance protein 41 [Lunasporangiospora selenospora]